MPKTMMPVALHKNNWKGGKGAKDAEPKTPKQQMQIFLRKKKG